MEVTVRPQPSVVRRTLDTVRGIHQTLLNFHGKMEDSKDVDETGDEEGEEDVFEVGPGRGEKTDSDEDIDDIELVFTTGETDPASIHEDLVSIQDGSNRQMNAVLVETDISKCGVGDEFDVGLVRRNTLPTPVPYRPIIHRELLGMGQQRPMKARAAPMRAVPKTESGAQTDITALPGQWKSETYLAHKISYNLPTLPSKFTLPVPRAPHLPLNNKTCEARRVLLSDINFTSMVPELSRSADHLHKDDEDPSQALCKNYPGAFDYMKSFDVGRDGRSRCCDLTRHGSRSSWGSYYGSRCQASTSSIIPATCPCPCEIQSRRRHSWRPPSTSCCHPGLPWSSVPSSPTRCTAPRKKVTFRPFNPHVHPGQSLPDLRDMDSSDSTDSLIDEAEDFLRHQIDALLIGRRGGRRRRRMSEANTQLGRDVYDVLSTCLDLISDFEPPKAAQPFLPRSPRDIKQGFLVKVITNEGRVVVGRVRYSGPVNGKAEPYVGVQLPAASGISDGTFLGHRYFEW